MTVIGYARVSTTDQDLSIQEAVLRAAGCDTIRAEKRSGSTTKGRDEMQIVLAGTPTSSDSGSSGAKWHDVNLAATLPGWTRFEAAQVWLDSHLRAAPPATATSGPAARPPF
jgi:Resolvase, N terminal domain